MRRVRQKAEGGRMNLPSGPRNVVGRTVNTVDAVPMVNSLHPSSFILHPSHPILHPSAPPTPHSRSGISLIEVLISMFVLLFGLLGVASFFPVGQHFVQKGDRLDRVAAVGQAAANDMATRGILRSDQWLQVHKNDPDEPLLNPADNQSFSRTVGVAIDPLGTAAGYEQGVDSDLLRFFPFAGGDTPLIRATIRDTAGRMRRQVAELIFQSRDDLAISIPDQGDEASNVLFEDDGNNPLRRQSIGGYSWLVTISPAYTDADNDGLLELATGNISRRAPNARA